MNIVVSFLVALLTRWFKFVSCSRSADCAKCCSFSSKVFAG